MEARPWLIWMRWPGARDERRSGDGCGPPSRIAAVVVPFGLLALAVSPKPRTGGRARVRAPGRHCYVRLAKCRGPSSRPFRPEARRDPDVRRALSPSRSKAGATRTGPSHSAAPAACWRACSPAEQARGTPSAPNPPDASASGVRLVWSPASPPRSAAPASGSAARSPFSRQWLVAPQSPGCRPKHGPSPGLSGEA